MSHRDAAVGAVRSRYESKYLVSHRLVGSIRNFIRPFVHPDPFAALHHDLRNPICGLYFDTADLELCRMTLQGLKNRYKLRVRSYSEDPIAPLFFEVKKRVDGAVLKCRCRMSREQGRTLLSGRTATGPRALPHLPAAPQEFTALTTLSDARPVLRVNYWPEAYESIGPDPMRLTIDTELRHAVTLDPDLSLDGAMDRSAQILNSSNRWFPDYSLEALVTSLLCAFVLAQVVAWACTWTHSALSYSRAFTQSLLLMAIVVTLVMFVIGNNIITAFGRIGAMAIIRFRNVLKDTRDTVFILFVLLLGMAAGTQRYGMALVGTAAFVLLAIYVHYTAFGTLGRFDGHVSLRLAAAGDDGVLRQTLERFCRPVKQVSIRQAGGDDTAEYLFQVRSRDRRRRREMLDELRSLQAVSDVSLVLCDELSEV